MTKRMLIDASHSEEVRVAIVDKDGLQDYDFESLENQNVKSNIYLAKVSRVEPSLQAAFVDYGGNRQGFLPFNEIHSDYFKIPVDDRAENFEKLKAEETARGLSKSLVAEDAPAVAEFSEETSTPQTEEITSRETQQAAAPHAEVLSNSPVEQSDDESASSLQNREPSVPASMSEVIVLGDKVQERVDPGLTNQDEVSAKEGDAAQNKALEKEGGDPADAAPLKEVGSDEEASGAEMAQEAQENPVLKGEQSSKKVKSTKDEKDQKSERRPKKQTLHQLYKIQEVIKKNQILLVQVAKEERGSKGAALTTYLSLAGRYCVLMPNSPRSGGVSRRISQLSDRKRLRAILDEISLPPTMSLIVRTAGKDRSKAEIKKDASYLFKTWDAVRETTLKSVAPSLIYQEGDLLKRSLRDIYSKDIQEILIEGEEAYKSSKTMMKDLMPGHAKRVLHYNDPDVSLFRKYKVDLQIDNMHHPEVRLPSGGMLVINQTEALVAIDINSGKSTRGRHIDETAFRTNLEAATEIPRQLRLRDLSGLVVIDFIDMDSSDHVKAVEKRLQEALEPDRARIQVAPMSMFGLVELSRQRLRPSFLEANAHVCEHCKGTGLSRSVSSSALEVLRAVDEAIVKGRFRKGAPIVVRVPQDVAFYVLNEKRQELLSLEQRYEVSVTFRADNRLVRPEYDIMSFEAYLKLLDAEEKKKEKAKPVPRAVAPVHALSAPFEEGESNDIEVEEDAESIASIAGSRRRNHRRGRRGGRRRDRQGGQQQHPSQVGRPDGEKRAEMKEKSAEKPRKSWWQRLLD